MEEPPNLPIAPADLKAGPVASDRPDRVQALFETDHLRTDLKRRSVRGGLVTLTSQAASFILSITSIALLSRLLDPRDFGLIAMVTALTGLAGLFTDLGLSQATIQRDKITSGQISTLFWVNVAVATAIALLIAACSPLIAWFYGDPRLIGIAFGAAAGIFVAGWGVQHKALLNRQMRFVSLGLVALVPQGLSLAVGAVLAMRGWGYWSLVWLNLSGAMITTLLLWLLTGWRPSAPKRRTGVRQMLAFGGYLSGFHVLNYFSRNADNILIGRVLGEGPLGYYSRAYSLLLLPLRQLTAPIASVILPALGRVQSEPKRYRRVYLEGLWLVTLTAGAGSIGLLLLSEELIILFLGRRWEESVVIFRYLAIAAPIQVITATTGWLYISSGQSARLLRNGLVTSSVIIASFVAGIPFGAAGVALAFSVAILVLFPFIVWHATRFSPVTMGDVLRTASGPLLMALGAAALGWGARALLPPADSMEYGLLLHLVTAASVFVAAYISLGLMLGAGKRVRSVLAHVKG